MQDKSLESLLALILVIVGVFVIIIAAFNSSFVGIACGIIALLVGLWLRHSKGKL
jgi:membrane-bound ClpP family serine protease